MGDFEYKSVDFKYKSANSGCKSVKNDNKKTVKKIQKLLVD